MSFDRVRSSSPKNSTPILFDYKSSCSLDQFPEQVMAEIYRRIHPEDRGSFRQTCKIWGNAAQESQSELEIKSLVPQPSVSDDHSGGVRLKRKLLEIFPKLDELKIKRCENATWKNIENLGISSFLNFLGLKFLDTCPGRELGHFKHFENLRVIEIYSCPNLGNQTLECFKEFPKLEKLMIHECTKVSAIGLTNLEQLKTLRLLQLCNCDAVSDEGLCYIGRLSQLKFILLADEHMRKDQRITDNGLAHLRGLDGLEGIQLKACTNLTKKAFEILGTLKDLRFLSIASCFQFTPNELKLAIDMNLLLLDLSYCQVNSQLIDYKKMSKSSICIDISGCNIALASLANNYQVFHIGETSLPLILGTITQMAFKYYISINGEKHINRALSKERKSNAFCFEEPSEVYKLFIHFLFLNHKLISSEIRQPMRKLVLPVLEQATPPFEMKKTLSKIQICINGLLWIFAWIRFYTNYIFTKARYLAY